MYRLPGIGEEYYRYIRTVGNPGPEAMAQALREAWADTDFYKSKSLDQVNWIRKNKDSRAMGKNLMCSLKNER